MRFFPELLPLYHPIEWSITRVAPDNGIYHYPVSLKNEVFKAGPLEIMRIAASVARARITRRKIANAHDYGVFWIGRRFFDRSGLAHYIERFYGVSGSELEPSFAEKRMGWLAESTSPIPLMKRMLGRTESGVKNQSFVRPRSGFNALYRKAQETLEAEGAAFSLGEELRSITRQGKLFSIQTDRQTLQCRRLISTIPVIQAHALCGLGPPPKLRSIKLVSLFFTFEGDRGFASNILYNFSREGRWKRITMFSDFYGLEEGKQYFGVEITSFDENLESPDELAAQFRIETQAKSLFSGTLRFVGAYELDNAYPIYEHGATERAKTAISALREFGVESLGRQGGFDYLPTARQVTLVVEEGMRAAVVS